MIKRDKRIRYNRMLVKGLITYSGEARKIEKRKKEGQRAEAVAIGELQVAREKRRAL